MLEAIKYAVQHGEFPDGELYIDVLNGNKFGRKMKATFKKMNETSEFKSKIQLR